MSCCGDCVYMDLNDERHGEYYCGKKGAYYSAADSTCWSFKEREDGGGCYLTTIMCNILGYADNGKMLNTLRFFRDNVMIKDSTYNHILLEYDVLGPQIAQCIEVDKNKLRIARKMKEDYIAPICGLLEKRNYVKAVEMYTEMVIKLKEHYYKKLLTL